MAKTKVLMVNKYGYDGLEDPKKRERMAFYERYEILKSGVETPTNVSPELNIKLIPTQYQNNIRDFHYSENKQYLTELKLNEEVVDSDDIFDIELEFHMDKRVMRYEARSLLVTITQAMSVFFSSIFTTLFMIDI
eukprot:CAMPEP_0205800272 /NCGR_PEP_ID=MMETSP0205-20121125/1879_1 /ASSEMBLY_ACC=CAM_ASM_000278 /TAXON_ID=36767 /ORGANISM="Euplotes focardii, Strain TN1" /LENGTH=134 /DNA_ID=CAMNT_0053063091 /DNA_START=753 /DNA_END=1154 /DNA_ORIENTATION=-